MVCGLFLVSEVVFGVVELVCVVLVVLLLFLLL